jgi:hypothetical protein
MYDVKLKPVLELYLNDLNSLRVAIAMSIYQD